MTNWQIPPLFDLPDWFKEAVRGYTLESDGRYVAQILWCRGIRNPLQLSAFLGTDTYQPKSPFDFGQEMNFAIKRLQKAQQTGEKVTIWGDFDADGVTATSVLWEGLGQFFPPYLQLDYYIPDRLTESHGLNFQGIERLAEKGTRLIITCDTGSTNLAEIDRANQLGIDIIVTDHHTLPDERPDVTALINPRYFVETHPLYHLSGVAVAYKLVEAMYLTFPNIPQQPLETLLDLVAIGLIADLVQLSGDCRYLAKKGIEQLQKQSQNPTRPGVAKLLEFCKRTGDRPTDISFGIGPRINAVSRIYGDASFCVELLTSKDIQHCKKLAEQAELANIRRKEIQQDIIKQVQKKLARIDLSTTNIIILEDPQWQAGILGLVAGQVAQEYQRPTILLSTSEAEDNSEIGLKLAKGSARSIRGIDLYQLVASQSHLLHRFGGHPFAAGLSLPVDNLPLFSEGINQQLRQTGIDLTTLSAVVEADLIVTVSELGQTLFRELKLLEPCGMGNPTPKLFIQKCWFTNIWQKNPQDLKGKKVSYPRTTFEIWDESVSEGFQGIWWGHSQNELSINTLYDAVIELDYNPAKDCYEVRLIALKSHDRESISYTNSVDRDFLIDWRNKVLAEEMSLSDLRLLLDCPSNWLKLSQEYRQAILRQKKLALAYFHPADFSSREVWKKLVGIAKYLIRTGESISQQDLKNKLNLSDDTLKLGLQALKESEIKYQKKGDRLQFQILQKHQTNKIKTTQFLDAINEEKFLEHYFSTIPIETLQIILEQTMQNR